MRVSSPQLRANEGRSLSAEPTSLLVSILLSLLRCQLFWLVEQELLLLSLCALYSGFTKLKKFFFLTEQIQNKEVEDVDRGKHLAEMQVRTLHTHARMYIHTITLTHSVTHGHTLTSQHAHGRVSELVSTIY